MADKITSQMAPEYHESGTQDARAWAMQTDRLLSTRNLPAGDRQFFPR
ncbi:hypothetical protein [Candidatus Aalborgicola defluviihabitans]